MLAACAAPAIVRADSLMRIVVPRREIILDPYCPPGSIFMMEEKIFAHPSVGPVFFQNRAWSAEGSTVFYSAPMSSSEWDGYEGRLHLPGLH